MKFKLWDLTFISFNLNFFLNEMSLESFNKGKGKVNYVPGISHKSLY